MANRGGQKGNNNAAKGREWFEALRYALANYEDDKTKRGQALKRIGKKLIEKALEGDMMAIKEIGDRIDGKAVQVIDATVTEVTSAAELTDEQLISIAATSSARAIKEKRGAEKSNSVH